jgi:hypothetical protein
MRHPFSELPAKFKIAFNSECTTYKYLVSNGVPSRFQGNSSSLHPRGKPLYPNEAIRLSAVAIQQPTCVPGSLERNAEILATPMKYSSQVKYVVLFILVIIL